MLIPWNLAIPCLVTYFREIRVHVRQESHSGIFIAALCVIAKTETTQMYTDKRMVKSTRYIHTVELSSSENEWTIAVGNNMGES